MMKQFLVGSILMGASSLVLADPGGCGWGAMLFDGQSGKAPHILAATTNGTSGNATFGMTSGTNGCDNLGTINYGGSALFASNNMDRLSNDIAKGDGEVLTSFAYVMGIQEQDIPTFKRIMHENFSTLYPNADVTSNQLVDSMVQVMQQDKELVKYI